MPRRPAFLIAAVLACAAAAPAPAAARTIKPLPASWQKGMNVAAFRWDHFSGDRFYYWMRQLRNARPRRPRDVRHALDPVLATTRCAATTYPRPTSTPPTGRPSAAGAARNDYTKCQTPSLGGHRARRCATPKSLGCEVALKPLVDVGRDRRAADRPRERRQLHRPRRAAAWFASYRAMLGKYAALARDVGAEMLVIGTGLTKMADNDRRAGRVAQDHRRHPQRRADGRRQGRLRRHADLLDALGRDLQGRLRRRPAAVLLGRPRRHRGRGLLAADRRQRPRPRQPAASARLRQGWTLNFLKGGMPPGAALRALHEKYGRPVVLTGLGYLSPRRHVGRPLQGRLRPGGASAASTTPGPGRARSGRASTSGAASPATAAGSAASTGGTGCPSSAPSRTTATTPRRASRPRPSCACATSGASPSSAGRAGCPADGRLSRAGWPTAPASGAAVTDGSGARPSSPGWPRTSPVRPRPRGGRSRARPRCGRGGRPAAARSSLAMRLRSCSAKCGVEAPISWRTSSTVTSRWGRARSGCSASLTAGRVGSSWPARSPAARRSAPGRRPRSPCRRR